MTDATANSSAHPPDRDAWLRVWYQVSNDDIRWAKQQGWRVVNWALLVLGALAGLAKYVSVQRPLVFALLGAGTVVSASIWLVDLHRSAESARGMCRAILDETQQTIPGASEATSSHRGYLVLQFAVLVVALVLYVVLLSVLCEQARHVAA